MAKQDQGWQIDDSASLLTRWATLCSLTSDDLTIDMIEGLASARWRTALYGSTCDDAIFALGLDRLAWQVQDRIRTKPAGAAALFGLLTRLLLLHAFLTEQARRPIPTSAIVARSLLGGPATALWQAADPTVSNAAEALAAVIGALAKHDRLTPRLVDVAAEVIASRSSPVVRDELLRAIAPGVAARYPQLGIALCRQIQHEGLRNAGLAALATVLAHGDLDVAEETALSITDPSFRCEAAVAVAHAMADRKRAVQLLADARRAAESTADQFLRCQGLLRTADELAADLPGDAEALFEETLGRIARIGDEVVRGEALVEAANYGSNARMRHTLLERTISLASALADASMRGETLAAICKAMPFHLRDLALATAQRLGDGWQRGEALGGIARAAASADGADGADVSSVLALIDDGWLRDRATSELVETLALSDQDSAVRMAREIADPWYRSRALAALGRCSRQSDSRLGIALLEEAAEAARLSPMPPTAARSWGAWPQTWRRWMRDGR